MPQRWAKEMKILKPLFWILLVGLIIGIFYPSINGIGGSALTINLEVLDATTRKAIPEATVTLISIPQRYDAYPNIVKAQTNTRGNAILREMFRATFDSGTNIYVGKSFVLCEAPGYLPVKIPLSVDGRFRFRKLLFYKQRQKVSLLALLENVPKKGRQATASPSPAT